MELDEAVTMKRSVRKPPSVRPRETRETKQYLIIFNLNDLSGG